MCATITFDEAAATLIGPNIPMLDPRPNVEHIGAISYQLPIQTQPASTPKPVGGGGPPFYL